LLDRTQIFLWWVGFVICPSSFSSIYFYIFKSQSAIRFDMYTCCRADLCDCFQKKNVEFYIVESQSAIRFAIFNPCEPILAIFWLCCDEWALLRAPHVLWWMDSCVVMNGFMCCDEWALLRACYVRWMWSVTCPSSFSSIHFSTVRPYLSLPCTRCRAVRADSWNFCLCCINGLRYLPLKFSSIHFLQVRVCLPRTITAELIREDFLCVVMNTGWRRPIGCLKL